MENFSEKDSTVFYSDVALPEVPIQDASKIKFLNDDNEVGHLEWGSGALKFVGNIEESAKIFFDFLKPYVDEYIDNEKGRSK